MPLPILLDTRQVACALKQGLDYVRRRTADPGHPEYIPNVKIGRKRMVHEEDLLEWLRKRGLLSITVTTINRNKPLN